MSYAQIGEDSDVYVWSNGDDLFCESEGKTFVCGQPRLMIEHLEMHKRRGHKVPDKALERLWHEHWGLPYETDVERSLKALRGLSGE